MIAADQEDIDSFVNNDDGDQSEDDEDNVSVEAFEEEVLIDLALTKTADATQVQVGDSFSYTITVSNEGPSDATGVIVNDDLPTGLSYLSDVPSTGDYTPATGEWIIGDLAVGANVTLTITVEASESGVTTNVAQVIAADQEDIDSFVNNDDGDQSEDDEDNVSVEAFEEEVLIDLALTKTADATQVQVGDSFSYTITVSNEGPSDATGVIVNDDLPTGLSYLSDVPSTGDYTPATGEWIIGDLAVGANVTLTITVEASESGVTTNVAQVIAADQDDVDSFVNNDDGDQSEDDEDNVSVEAVEEVVLIDLSLTKTADATQVQVGDTFSYTITVSNEGPFDATGVEVFDQLPTNIGFINSIPSTGTYSVGTGIWTIGNLAVGTSVTLTIIVEAIEAGSIENIAQISAADQEDIDSFINNDDGDQSEDDEDGVIVEANEVPTFVDVQLTKIVDVQNVLVGDQVTYTLTLTNEGPDVATAIQVLDQLPTGLSYESSIPSTGNYNAATGIWTLNQMNPNVTETLQITATVLEVGSIENIAQVIALNETDIDSTPNNDNGDQSEDDEDNASIEAMESVELIDLSVLKTADVTAINIGDTITYTITVSNEGPNDATGVVVNDDLPTGVTYIGDTPSTGDYTPATGEWNIGTLTVGQSVTLTISVEAQAEGMIENIAQVIAADQIDIDSTPNNDDGDQNEDDEDGVNVGVNMLVADLALTKDVNNTTVSQGDTITYTLIVTNEGPTNATGVSILDELPNVVSYESSTATVGSYNNATAIWTIGDLAVGQNATLSIDVIAIGEGNVTNIAQILTSDQADVDSNPNNDDGDQSEDDEDNANILIEVESELVDLELTKTANVTNITVGDQFMYIINLMNEGPNDATGVSVFDQLPSGVTFIDAMASTGTYSPATGLWTIGELAAGDNASLSILVEATGTGSILNTAQVASLDQTDGDSKPNNDDGDQSEDDEDNVEVNVGDLLIDLDLTKTASSTEVNVGDNFTYTITIMNEGPNDATGIEVFDLLPVQVSYQNSNSTQGVFNPNTAIWTVGDLAVGESASLDIIVQVEAGGNFLNIAQVSAADQNDIDSTPNNNQPNEDDQDDVSVNGVAIDLELEKTVSPTGNVNIGENVTYLLTLTNNGGSDATGVQVADQLPSQLTIISGNTESGSYTNDIWNIGNVAAGETVTLEIVATVTGEGEITNTAQVIAADQPDIDSTPNNNEPNEDDQDEVTIGSDAADLGVMKEVDNNSPTLGDIITYTIVIENNGGSTATNIEVTEQLPAQLSFVLANTSKGFYSNATGLWTIDQMNVGTTETLTIQAEVVAPGDIINTVTITGSDQPDLDDSNNSDMVTIGVELIDLALTKTSDVTEVNVGDDFTYTLTLTNEGPSDATGVVVFDNLPSGVSFVNATPSVGTFSDQTGQWNIGNVANGATVTLNILVRLEEAGSVINVAQIIEADQTDIDSTPNNDNGDQSEDDEDNTMVTGVASDLSLVKTANVTEVNVGSMVTYNIELTNDGPSNATGIIVSEQLPAALALDNVAPSIGTYNNGQWSVPNLSVGQTATLTITATVVDDGEITNSVEVIASDQPDPDSTPDNDNPNEDDQDEITIGGVSTDLSLNKMVEPGIARIGDIVTFTITIENDGSADATNVIVSDQVPSGFNIENIQTSTGTYNEATGLWNIPAVESGEEETLVIIATVADFGNLTNVAEVIASDQPDTDSTPDNNDPTEDDQDDATVQSTVADLELQKSVNTPSVLAGEIVTYTLILTNNGPDEATNVEVLDQLPDGVLYVGNTASAGLFNAATNIWSVPALAAGEMATLDLLVEVTGSNNITNIAQVIASDQPDPDSMPSNDDGDQSEDDEDSADINAINLVDVNLTKTANVTEVNVGDQITYTIVVNNEGPLTATGIEVFDALPGGVSYINANATQGSYSPLSGIWTVGELVVNESATLEIAVTVENAGSITNTAQVSALDQDDIDSTPNNNMANEDDQDEATVSGTQIDLSLVKMLETTGEIVLGDQVSYVLQVTNDGPSDATGVQVIDQLPEGLTFVNAIGGDYNAVSGIWNVGNLPAQDSRSLTLIATVTGEGNIVNKAEVFAADQPDADSTPNNDDVTEDDQDEVFLNSVGMIDMELMKEANVSEVNVGDEVIFTIMIDNNGGSTATGVVVTDNLPDGLTLIEAVPSQGTFISPNWNVGEVEAGQMATLLLRVQVTAAGSITNIAEITNANEQDMDSTPNNNDPNEDDQDSATIGGQQIDLELSKTVDATQADLGSNITYTLTLTNTSGSDATGVSVFDELPPQLSFVSQNASIGTYSSNTGQWNIGNVPAGGTVTLEIVASVQAPGDIINVAQVSAADQPDVDSSPANDDGDQSEDDEDSAVISAIVIDLELNKEVTVEDGFVGDNITYNLTVTNEGPGNATGIQVTDQLPPQLQYVSSTGDYNEVTGVWNVGSLGVNESSNIAITATILAEGTINNIAEVTAADQTDLDSTPNNDNGDQSEDDEDAVSFDAPVNPDDLIADLSLTKVVETEEVAVGENVSFMITVENQGPADAGSVEVTDQLPDGLIYVTSTPSIGAYNELTGLWTIGTINAGDQATLQIVATVTGAGPYINTAEITNSDKEDPDSTPNNNQPNEDDQDSAGVGGQLVDIELVKEVVFGDYSFGEIVEYIITVYNQGPRDATGLEVTDELPVALVYVGSNPSTGMYNDGNGLWTIGNLAAGDSVQLSIQAQIREITNIVNIAEVTALDQNDTDSTPNNNVMEEDDQDEATFEANLQRPGQLGGVAWFDENGNGLQDDNEMFLEGLTVTLSSFEGAIATSTTAANGSYGFDNLQPYNDYQITIEIPTGYAPTTQNTGLNIQIDSDIDNTGTMTGVMLGPDEFILNLDAGFILSDGGFANIAGCMDESATNFNPNATVDDGSCEYASGLSEEFILACTAPVTQTVLCVEANEEFVLTEVISLFGNNTSILNEECVRYTPLPAFENIGIDTVDLIVCNTTGICDTATAIIEVGNCEGLALQPIANNDAASSQNGQATIINVLANDEDPQGEALSICMQEGDGAPTNGMLTLNTDGSMTYTPNTAFSGTDSFTYTVCNESGAMSQASVVITVDPTASTCNNDLDICTRPFPYPALTVCTDFCIENPVLESVEPIFFECTLDIISEDCFTYLPLPSFVGDEILEVIACNAMGQCDTTYINILVTEECESPGEDAFRLAAPAQDWKANFEAITIPNVFTPNNDGINEVFQIKDIPSDLEAHLTIFDKTGNTMTDFRTSGDNIQWNGTNENGQTLPIGIYYYRIELTDAQNTTATRTGFIELRK